ncbi:MAG: tyrosine-type recombinase/integrase [bacterium]|nr:tyrosine-type recombinase/integrase [bacterium]
MKKKPPSKSWGYAYRPKGRGDVPTSIYWLKFKRTGDSEPTRERTNPPTSDEREAQRQLHARLGETQQARMERRQKDHCEGVTINDILDLYVIDCRRLGRPIQQGRIEPWRHELGNALTTEVQAIDLDDLADLWQRRGLVWDGGSRTLRDGSIITWDARDPARIRPISGASVNRLMASLRRSYTLGRSKLGLSYVPVFPRQPEFARDTDLAEDECLAIVQHFKAKRGADVKADVFRLGYLLGIRKGQLRRTLKRYVMTNATPWRIDWPGETTKNRKDHRVALHGEALEIVQRAWARRRPDVDELFHVDGAPLGPMTSELKRTCEAVAVAYGRTNGITFHSTRHAAVTNLLAAGIDAAAAMSITGHVDPSTFRRYHERRDSVQTAAQEKMAAYLAQQRGTTVAVTQREGTTGHDNEPDSGHALRA